MFKLQSSMLSQRSPDVVYRDLSGFYRLQTLDFSLRKNVAPCSTLYAREDTPVLAGTMQSKWGAHAPPRAVFRALAEHIGLLLWPNRSASRKNWNQRAKAPAGTREGARAPRNELNRSGLVNPSDPQSKPNLGVDVPNIPQSNARRHAGHVPNVPAAKPSVHL
jgi:hypothetical protein